MKLAVEKVLMAKREADARINAATIKVEMLTQRVPQNQDEVNRFNAYTKELASVAVRLEEALAKYDDEIPAFESKAKACHDEFEALSEETKKGILNTRKELSDERTELKNQLVRHPLVKLEVATFKHRTQMDVYSSVDWVNFKRQSALEEKLFEGDVNEKTLRDVNALYREYDNAAKEAKGLALAQATLVRDSEEILLDRKRLQIIRATDKNLDKKALTAEFKQSLHQAWSEHSHICFDGVANIAAENLRMLLPLIEYQNDGLADKKLNDWHERTCAWLFKDFSSALHEFQQLIMKERKENDPGKKSGEDLSQSSQMLKLARQSQDKLETILGLCKTSLEEYENLQGINKDKRVTASLKTLVDAISDTLPSRERCIQFWADKVEELEEKKSFLPQRLRAQSSRPKKSQPSSSQLQPSSSSQSKDMHETPSGIVFGQIIQEATLEQSGKWGVASTYFKDDTGNWIKDYGDTSELSQAESSTSTSQTAGRNKADEWVEKAGKIVDASIRFSENIDNEVKAIEASAIDYAEKLKKKIDSLERAIAYQAQSITNRLTKPLAELMGMQKTADESVKKQIDSVKQNIASLKKKKKELEDERDRLRDEQNIHNHKRRAPNGPSLTTLFKENQVASVVKNFPRRQNRAEDRENDWLERYTISFKSAPQGETYEDWVVHAHYDSDAPEAKPETVHMKYEKQKDFGRDEHPYHSLPLQTKTFEKIVEEAKKQEAPAQEAAVQGAQKQQGTSKKGKHKKHR